MIEADYDVRFFRYFSAVRGSLPSRSLKNIADVEGAQAWDIRSLGFSWFLHHKVFMGRWFGGKNINLLFKFLRELSRI